LSLEERQAFPENESAALDVHTANGSPDVAIEEISKSKVKDVGLGFGMNNE